MKPFILLIVTLLISLHGQTQSSWFPTGAKWYYQYGSMLGPGMTTIEVMNEDTIIGTWTYRKLLSTTIGEFLGSLDTFTESLYVHEENQLLYGYDRYLGGTFLYDFNATPGDTLPMFFGGLSPEPFVVDSIGEIEFNGQQLAFQDIQFPNYFGPGEYYTMRVIERIGTINSHLFHSHTIIQPTDAPSYHLRCYEDDELGLIRLTDDSGPCNLFEGPTFTSEREEAAISIFPNPAYDVINVQGFQKDIDQFRVVDMLGAVRTRSNFINQSTLEIDIHNLESGLYYLIGSGKSGEILFTRKISKISH